jgi:hypothetical protein
MTANEPPAADQRRLAEYELAELNRDWAARTVALGAVQDSLGGALAGFETARPVTSTRWLRWQAKTVRDAACDVRSHLSSDSADAQLATHNLRCRCTVDRR